MPPTIFSLTGSGTECRKQQLKAAGELAGLYAFGHHTVFLRLAMRACTRRFLARTSGPAGGTDGGSPQPRYFPAGSRRGVRLLRPQAPGLVSRRMGKVAFACHSHAAKKTAPASGIRRNCASVPPGARAFSEPACCYPHRLWPLGFMVAYRLDYVPSPYPMSERVKTLRSSSLRRLLAGEQPGGVAGISYPYP